MKRQKSKAKIKYRIVESFGLPKDLMLGAAMLHVTGHSEAYVENYKGIVEYSPTKVKIRTKEGCIEIEGNNLSIGYYSGEEMKVSGCILRISYC